MAVVFAELYDLVDVIYVPYTIADFVFVGVLHTNCALMPYTPTVQAKKTPHKKNSHTYFTVDLVFIVWFVYKFLSSGWLNSSSTTKSFFAGSFPVLAFLLPPRRASFLCSSGTPSSFGIRIAAFVNSFCWGFLIGLFFVYWCPTLRCSALIALSK